MEGSEMKDRSGVPAVSAGRGSRRPPPSAGLPEPRNASRPPKPFGAGICGAELRLGVSDHVRA